MDGGSGHCIQEAVIQTIPKKNKCKKAKWLSEEAFQIAEKSERQRRKGKIYLSECRAHSKETEENLPKCSMQRNRGNNRMGKTRDLFKKIRDPKGKFHAKMDTIKDRNGMDLTEA